MFSARYGRNTLKCYFENFAMTLNNVAVDDDNDNNNNNNNNAGYNVSNHYS